MSLPYITRKAPPWTPFRCRCLCRPRGFLKLLASYVPCACHLSLLLSVSKVLFTTPGLTCTPAPEEPQPRSPCPSQAGAADLQSQTTVVRAPPSTSLALNALLLPPLCLSSRWVGSACPDRIAVASGLRAPKHEELEVSRGQPQLSANGTCTESLRPGQ